MTLNEIHSLIGPYALDALDAEERAYFEAHLGQCEECRAELAGFVATTMRLGDVPALTPPPEFKQRLMTAVTHTPQERPIVTALASRSRLRRTLPRLAVAAATVFALGGFGAFAAEYQRNTDLEAQQNMMTRVFTASDSDFNFAKLKTGGSLRMITSHSVGSAVMIATDLPALPGKSYQLWIIKKGDAQSQGVFDANSSMKLMKRTSGADTVAVTIEPAGGSKSPTTPALAAMPI